MNKNRKSVKRQQPRKDSKSKRVNYDNERESKFDREIKEIGKTCASNDVRWYAHNAELLRSAASLPFSNVTGSNIGWEGATASGLNVPGVFALYHLPSIGGWSDAAVNSSKESIYSYVVHANSRNTSYNSTDLMLVILAGSQIFASLANAIRAYGIMKTFDQRNKYLPMALVQACGFKYADLQNNLANMWFDINEMIARASQIWIPNTLPVLDRWFWLNSNVYMDSASVKGQYYMFTQRHFWIYNETQSDKGGGLNWIKPDGTPLTTEDTGKAFDNTNTYTWASYMTMMNGMFNALLNSEDRGVIMGDILKAYGAERIYAIKPIPSDYIITPQYDTEVLTQIENADICSTVYYGVTQNPNTLQLETQWTAWASAPTLSSICPDQAILNFHQKETPTPEQIMVATRLKVLGSHIIPQTADPTKISVIIPDTTGTEYVQIMAYFAFNVSGTLTWNEYLPKEIGSVGERDTYGQLAFDWCPWQYEIVGTAPAKDAPISSFEPPKVKAGLGDYDNYTVIDKRTLQKMHTTAVYSEFGVPTI